MDIEDSFDIISDTVKEYYESRLFKQYIHIVDKNKFKTYNEYKEKAMGSEQTNTYIDVKDRKKQAEETLKAFMEGGK